jgi:hypothetical protein
MINPSSKQNLDPSRKVLAISKTIIPLDYDKSTQGFNDWADYLRNELHVNSQPFSVHNVVQEATKVLNFYKPPTNVRKR